MSLVNRVSAFFLIALAAVLILVSLVFYSLTSHHLRQQFDEQLHGALHTLVAAVEVESDDVKWEPSDHAISLGIEDGLEDVRWAVADEKGAIVDQSRNLHPAKLPDQQFLKFAAATHTEGESSFDVGDWGVLQERLAATEPKPPEERDELEREAIVVTVGRSAVQLNSNLRLLALLATALPVGAWLFAAVVGRWFCARALRPVQEMAAQTRAMRESGFAGRLAVPDSRDELADLGQSFNAVLERLTEAFERQKHFTGDAAHQLRTPLAVLLGQIEVSLRQPRSPDDYRQTLGTLKQQVNELNQIVSGLLYLARADADESPPDMQPVNLATWFENYFERWRRHPRSSDIALRVEDGLGVTASPQLLSQLLDNLIDNALKYSEPGTRVEVSAIRSGDRAVITVADEGPGISASERQEIFQPFYRSQDARQAGVNGTGLGLAIVARIASAMQGEVRCEANEPCGSRLELRLPLAQHAATSPALPRFA